MSPKRYFIYVLAAALGLVAAAWALAWWLEPLYGDLTRIGGYAERDYGGNAPMLEFRPLAASWGQDYRPADILVIGDSFANIRPPQQWQNWLAVRTGLTIHTLDVNRLEINALLNNPLYRLHPPRMVIWNVVERDLLNEYGTENLDCGPDLPHPHVAPLLVNFTGQAPVQVWRSHALYELNPGFARIWLWKNLLRHIADLNTSESLDLPLARRGLFSSWLSDTLLFYRHDLGKRKWRTGDLERIRCGFHRLAVRFEANGKTRFLTALAPDKSSAYRPWLANPASLPDARLPALLDRFPVPDARLDQSIAAALAAGTRDVYMSDDTHWGTAGHSLASEAILKLLSSLGLAKEGV